MQRFPAIVPRFCTCTAPTSRAAARNASKQRGREAAAISLQVVAPPMRTSSGENSIPRNSPTRETSMTAPLTVRLPSAGKKSVPPASTCPPSARAWVVSRSVVGRRNKGRPWTMRCSAESSSPFYTNPLELYTTTRGLCKDFLPASVVSGRIRLPAPVSHERGGMPPQLRTEPGHTRQAFDAGGNRSSTTRPAS